MNRANRVYVRNGGNFLGFDNELFDISKNSYQSQTKAFSLSNTHLWSKVRSLDTRSGQDQSDQISP